MRGLCVLAVGVILGSLVETCSAADVTYQEGTYQEAWDAGGCWDDQAACCDAGFECSGGGCCNVAAFPPCRRSGEPCCKCRLGCGREPRRSRVARIGDFNCGCRGSYKFPVPPQYTYHWPGLYAQQTMTEYNSPWRFPGLRLYEGDSTQLEQGAGKLARRERLPAVTSAGDSEPASLKIKRRFGVQ